MLWAIQKSFEAQEKRGSLWNKVYIFMPTTRSSLISQQRNLSNPTLVSYYIILGGGGDPSALLFAWEFGAYERGGTRRGGEIKSRPPIIFGMEATGRRRRSLRMLISLIRALVFLQIGINRPHSSADAFQPHLLLSASSRCTPSLQLARRCDEDISVLLKSNQSDDTTLTQEGEDLDSDEQLDTIRVRIWRQLADGKELSLSQLSNAVGERRLGELRSHLTHVEKQAKTIRNKSDEWRIRRGLSPVVGNNGKADAPRKMKLKFRKGKKNETFVRIV